MQQPSSTMESPLSGKKRKRSFHENPTTPIQIALPAFSINNGNVQGNAGLRKLFSPAILPNANNMPAKNVFKDVHPNHHHHDHLHNHHQNAEVDDLKALVPKKINLLNPQLFPTSPKPSAAPTSPDIKANLNVNGHRHQQQHVVPTPQNQINFELIITPKCPQKTRARMSLHVPSENKECFDILFKYANNKALFVSDFVDKLLPIQHFKNHTIENDICLKSQNLEPDVSTSSPSTSSPTTTTSASQACDPSQSQSPDLLPPTKTEKISSNESNYTKFAHMACGEFNIRCHDDKSKLAISFLKGLLIRKDEAALVPLGADSPFQLFLVLASDDLFAPPSDPIYNTRPEDVHSNPTLTTPTTLTMLPMNSLPQKKDFRETYKPEDDELDEIEDNFNEKIMFDEDDPIESSESEIPSCAEYGNPKNLPYNQNNQTKDKITKQKTNIWKQDSQNLNEKTKNYDEITFNIKTLLLPKFNFVLDLDETLIRSRIHPVVASILKETQINQKTSEVSVNNKKFKLIKTWNDEDLKNPSHILKGEELLLVGDVEFPYLCCQRPGTENVLNWASKIFNVKIVTNALFDYAKEVVTKVLDRDKKNLLFNLNYVKPKKDEEQMDESEESEPKMKKRRLDRENLDSLLKDLIFSRDVRGNSSGNSQSFIQNNSNSGSSKKSLASLGLKNFDSIILDDDENVWEQEDYISMLPFSLVTKDQTAMGFFEQTRGYAWKSLFDLQRKRYHILKEKKNEIDLKEQKEKLEKEKQALLNKDQNQSSEIEIVQSATIQEKDKLKTAASHSVLSPEGAGGEDKKNKITFSQRVCLEQQKELTPPAAPPK